MSLILNALTRRFSGFAALDNVSFTAAPGEFIALLGPSGSGKTTLLRLLAGLDTPDSGEISFEGEDFVRSNPRKRRIGMVFQSYALFRHMTVADNIAFGLNIRSRSERPSRAEISATVTRLLKLIQMEDLSKRFPSQLSGGQRQRVALARALAINPRLLLLDEPFGALDALVRKDLRRWLRRVHDETGITTVFVTHDQEEAMDLADRVVVLKAGAVEQIGTPLKLHQRPASGFVFDFLGAANQASGAVSSGVARFEGFEAPAVVSPSAPGTYLARFRPYESDLSRDGPGLIATVSAVLPAGGRLRLELTGPEGQLYETEHTYGGFESGLAVGDVVRLRPQRVFVYD